MRIVVVGSGAIGLLYGGWLQTAGADVHFVTRPSRLAALRATPLTAAGRLSFRLEQVKAIDNALKAGPADVVILAVKLYDLAAAAQEALPALAQDGVLVAVQNGVNVYRTMRPIVESSRIAVGPVYAATKMTGPSSVSYVGSERVVLGNPECALPAKAEHLLQLWRKAGLDAQATDDINKVVWTKFVGLATNAALTCMARLPAGVLYHTAELIELAKQSIDEVIAVGRAEGIEFPASMPQDALASLQRFPPATVASMRQDLDAGKPLELDFISGEIVRLGQKHGIPTPLHSMAYTLLKPFRNGHPARPAEPLVPESDPAS